jgi:hypothetical protein
MDPTELRIHETRRRYWQRAAHQQAEDKQQRNGDLEAEGELLEAAVAVLGSPARIEAFDSRTNARQLPRIFPSVLK